MERILGFAIIFGVIMATYYEIKDRRWANKNPHKAAKWEWKNGGVM